jgi:ATP-dependent helicase HrpA
MSIRPTEAQQAALNTHPLLTRDRKNLTGYLANLNKRAKRGQPMDKSLGKWTRQFEQAQADWVAFQQAVPTLLYPEDLPVSQKREEIVSAIEQHPVVIICGDTGSGKTTQLPKMIYEAGGGHHGRIGVTQPRRLAATEMARRVAEECQVEYGSVVGARVRFDDKTSKNTRIQFMTDGLLLAQLPSDPDWLEYNTILIDEAHERSLNIDFILGCLRSLLQRRQDLKVVISSATLDAERFSAFFGNAPILTVEGRLHPIQDVFQPLAPGRDLDIQDHVLESMRETDQVHGAKDTLIFLPGEREIRETARKLEGHYRERADILPLFARLGAADQRKVFGSSSRRRIVLATNVAETSLTIPGIRTVIDTGLVRIQRYHPQSQVQRLVTERVSRASAGQRRGRCGRTGPGVCVRLYSEEDLESAPAYTDPEIRRSSLAEVILRMAVLGLPPLGQFELIDSPKGAQVNEGYRTLIDIGAMTDKRTITSRGRRLATFHLEPRLARMLEEGHEEKVLPAVLVCAAFLSIQDPRERPAEKAEAADRAHALWRDPTSDFLSILNLWNALCSASPSRSKRNKFCNTHFLHPKRVQEWVNLVDDLRETCAEHDWDVPSSIGELELLDAEGLHRSILSGIPRSVGERQETKEFRSPGGQNFLLFPGSGCSKKPPRWVMSFTLLQTSRLFARECAQIDPEWIEQVAPHLCAYQYERPVWNETRGFVEAEERVSMGQLMIRSGRKVHYGRIDPVEAREIFLRDAVEPGDLDCNTPAYRAYGKLRSSLHSWEQKLRRPGYFLGSDALLQHLHHTVPTGICTRKDFITWSKKSHWLPDIKEVLGDESVRPDGFPDELQIGDVTVQIRYAYAPQDPDQDGITYVVKEEDLPSLSDGLLEWVVPGMREEQLQALIRTLDKPLRIACNPLQETVQELNTWLEENKFAYSYSLTKSVAAFLAVKLDRILAAPDLHFENIAAYLRPRLDVVDAAGQVIYSGNSFPGKQDVASLSGPVKRIPQVSGQTEGLTTWPACDFSQPEIHNGTEHWPALLDMGTHCGVRLFGNQEQAQRNHREGVIRLFQIQQPDTMRFLQKRLPIPTMTLMDLHTLPGSNEDTLDDLIHSILYEALFPNGNPPYTASAFQNASDYARGELFEIAEKRAAQLTTILELRSEVNGKIGPELPVDTRADLELQLQTLWPPGWSKNPEVFVRYPKYLQGIQVRIERCTRDNGKELRKLYELDPSLTLLSEHLGHLEPDQLRQAFLKLNELRLSIFSPELKPHEKISAKRFEQWLQQITQSS